MVTIALVIGRLGLAVLLTALVVDHGAESTQVDRAAPPEDGAPAADGAEPEAPPKPEIPRWRFRDDSRPIKVIVIAGSVGAWMRDPYHARLEKVCSKIEVHNLSKAALGGLALKQRFRDMAVKNPAVRPKSHPEHEYWVMVGAGVNNLYNPKGASHHLKNLMAMAHNAGMWVVGLTPTPWGKRTHTKHQGYEGLTRRKATQHVTDFMMVELTPAEALGKYADKRPFGVDPPFLGYELPDIPVDLYDSALRDREAEPYDTEDMRARLAKDPDWQRTHRDLDETSRAAALDADAKLAAEMPRWHMRPDLHAFDDVHPNAEGHRLIAATICPKLPERWSCDCAALDESPQG